MARTRQWERDVRALARVRGVQLAYTDVEGRRQHASIDVLIATLTAMGAIERAGDVADALGHHAARDAQVVDPVVVAWDGKLQSRIGRHAVDADRPCRVTLETEHGDELELGAEPVDRVVPLGVHRLHVARGRDVSTASLIAAPRCCWTGVRTRTWGAFAPVYALRDGPDLGAGHLGHLRRLGEWIGGKGGQVLATLPLLPVYLSDPFEPSPYLPVSRRHWNEALLDPSSFPGAREAVRCHAERFVDWHAVACASRALLDHAVSTLGSQQEAQMQAFLGAHPDVARYARFRAAAERACGSAHGDQASDPIAERRHVFGQWQAREQIAALVGDLHARGVGLVLDLPVGTHPQGYDVWDAPDDYVRDVSIGAPPDDFFTEGQRWGTPPPRPDAGLVDGFARWRAVLAHHMGPASFLRIDHVMGLHRLFWVPDGFAPREGVYVRYPSDALWAIVSLESHRHQCCIVGEDLGTVPRAVRRAMAEHGALRTWVAQFATELEPAPRLPRRAMAWLSTHDTPTFAAWWRGSDPSGALARLLDALGRSQADAVVVNLEDLWGEREPQNVPGTAGVANWRRRHRLSLPDLDSQPDFSRPLELLARSRSRSDAAW